MAASITNDGSTAYRVIEGVCFLKPSENPEGDQIKKLKWPVGSIIHTTGRTWMGSQGGLWAEVDIMREARMKMGWINVKGLTKRPLLLDVTKEDTSQVIHVRYTKDAPIFSCLMQGDATIGSFINIFCSRTGLDGNNVILTKGKPAKVPDGSGKFLPPDYTSREDILKHHMTIKDAGITEPLNLICLGGDFEKSHKFLRALEDGAVGGA